MFSIAGAISGIVVGCLVFTTVIVIVVIAVRRRRGVIVVCTYNSQSGIERYRHILLVKHVKRKHTFSFDMVHEKK